MTGISDGTAGTSRRPANAPWTVEPLTRDAVTRHLEALQRIDAAVIGVPWHAEQWQLDLPAKWELSRMAVANGIPLGFLVASARDGAVHCHRIAVAVDAYRQGLGTVLLRTVAALAVARGEEAFTVKVHRTNARSLAFLQHAGFTIARHDGDNFLLTALPDRVARRS